jgi:hypothetical protein
MQSACSSALLLHQIAKYGLKPLHQQPLIQQLSEQWQERYGSQSPLVSASQSQGTLDSDRTGNNPMALK